MSGQKFINLSQPACLPGLLQTLCCIFILEAKPGVEPGKMLVWNEAWQNYGNKILLLRVGLLYSCLSISYCEEETAGCIV